MRSNEIVREKVYLYISDKKVDLDDSSFILFNYTMEDLNNPTIVKNSFSKQITLKGTPANNEIFGNLYRSDRQTQLDDGYTGVFFDPLRKTPFTIYNEMNDILESGYVKVDSVDKVSGGYEYKVTLYGGLGSFFYELTYNEEGAKRTLNDLVWQYYDGHESELTPFLLTKEVLVNKAWKYIEQGNSYLNDNPSEYWDILNFAPCYNGLPSDFDADKILTNEVAEKDEEGVTYRYKEGCSSCLVKMEKPHTEWEVRNIRPYLQRPVVRIKSIIDAIAIEARKKGYKIELDSKFFVNTNRYYNRAWITLPMIDKEYRNSPDIVSSILSSSLTPCDYLLGFAKTFGLVFLYDNAEKKIIISARNTFYSGETIDLSKRIDSNSIGVQPILSDSRWYQFGGDKVVGEDAKSLEDHYGRPYGSKRVNTGYEFNSDISHVTKDIPFITAADVIEKNLTNVILFSGGIGYWSMEMNPLRAYENFKKTLYNADGESKEFDMPRTGILAVYFDDNYPYEDFFPKVQFHDAENKAAAGEHCMLFLAGSVTCPTRQPQFTDASGTLTYYVSDDHPDTEVLNAGKPCWNLAGGQTMAITQIPSFRRTLPADATMEWGVPADVFTHDNWQYLSPIYDRYWKAHIADIYDVDSRLMKCKVNLSGMQVGQSLMRNFFFYENAIWVLNKISNHSITTDDLTECEFVKVKDIKNYTEGQNL